MNRRGFIGSILAACAAPAIVRADSLMRIVPAETATLDPWDLGAGEYDVPSYAAARGIAGRGLWAHAYCDDFSKNVIVPAMRRISADMERRVLADIYGIRA